MKYSRGRGDHSWRRAALDAFLRRAAGVAAVLCLGAPQMAQAQQPDTIQPILNRVEATYQTTTGVTGRVWDDAVVQLRLRPGLSLSPGESAQLCGGEGRLFEHVLRNDGNGPDKITLEALFAEGVSGTIGLDAGDGAAQGRDLDELTEPLTVERGDSVTVFLYVETDEELEDVEAEVRLRASSSVDPAVTAEAVHTLHICGPPPVLGLTLSADRSQVTAGDTLGYTLEVENSGNRPSFEGALVDTLPPSVRMLDGTVVQDTLTLDSGAGGYVLETLDDGRQLLRVPLDTLGVGATSRISYHTLVVVDSSTTSIANTVAVSEHAVTSISNAVEVDVELPEIELEMRILDRSLIFAGDTVTFELSYENVSTVHAKNATLTNTLPAEMRFIGADTEPSHTSQVDPVRIQDADSVGAHPVEVSFNPRSGSPGDKRLAKAIVWELGTLEPGASGTILLHAKLPEALSYEREELYNHASLSVGSAGYSIAIAAKALPFTIGADAGAELTLSKSAGQLEVGLGEAVPYTLEVENTGDLPLHSVVIEDRLPEEIELVQDAVTGADSVWTEGRTAFFHLQSPLGPGMTHTVRYATIATSARGEAVANRALARAEEGRVVSDSAVAWVRIRRGPSLPARTLIGKVWVDHDGDGRQGPDDPGLGGVDIWTSDGQVVRTDEDGRFSLQDLEPGRYTLRLDMLGLEDDYELASRGGEIQDVRMDGWTMGRADFRLVPRRVVVDQHAGPPPELLVAASDDAAPADSGTAAADGVFVAPARSAEERQEARRQELTAGPGVEFTSPADGTVVTSGRVYIGARGEAGRPLELLDAEGVRRTGTLRPDGVFDFVAVELEPGPNHFRVRMTNSWGTERWDSITVHRSGRPAHFEVEEAPDHLRAESPQVDTLRLRVLDAWGVPVVSAPAVTIDAEGVSIEADDEDRSTVGHQLRADSRGWLHVPIRAGSTAGLGHVTLHAGDAEHVLSMQLLPPVRPLIATMSGRVGLGGAEDGSFASITARGAIDELTSFTLSYDTRRGDEEMATFGRGYDPLDETLYPTTGDFSQRRVLSGSSDAFSARIERGLDWVAFGDVRTEGFSGGQLTTYDRALSGVSSRITTGPVVWHGFGSATRQRLEETQLRGGDGSGPYTLGGMIRPGTEVLTIEVRAQDNAARVISRTPLTRYVDYQIDYRTGEVLLNRLLPAADGHGNPVFLVATHERLDAEERHWVGGLRMEIDAAQALGLHRADSLGVSVFGIRDGSDMTLASPEAHGAELLGGEVEAQFGASRIGLELLQANTHPDSTGLAGRASLEWTAWQDRARLRGEWLGIGDGFSSRQHARLRSGLEELRLGGDLRLTDRTQLQLDHDRQDFRAHDVARQTHRARLEHARGEQIYALESGLIQESRGGASSSDALRTRINASLSPEITVWAEHRHALTEPLTRHGSDQVGGGVSVRLLERLRAEGQYRRIEAEKPYTLSSLMLNVDSWEGGRVWGGVESTEGVQRDHGIAFGWSQELGLPAGWSLTSQLERRFGLDELDLVDPVRALPFPQTERDRFSAGLGTRWRNVAGDRSFSARGEYNDGAFGNGYRIESQSDVRLGTDVTLLMRHNWLLNERLRGAALEIDRRDHSLLGLAFRPSASNSLDALGKIEWRRTIRPDTYADPTLAGDNARLIGSADLVWSPAPVTQATFRYAIRGNTYSNQAFGELEVRSTAHFLGTSIEHALHGRLSGRVDSRLLHAATTDDSRWSLAPTLVFDLTEFEIEAGYRFGNLQDIDFAGRGGLGLFASIGVRLTERSAAGIAEFWRER